jgi:cytochrome c
MHSLAAAAAMALFSSGANAGLDDAKAQELMKKGGCNACHNVDKKIIGPAFKDVALKHKGQADAVATLEKVVRTGSKGTYGAMPMPPVPAAKLGDGELHELVEWVLTK